MNSTPNIGPFNPPTPRPVQANGRGYSVLSFDGGGFRGYASLLILRRLLQLVQTDGGKIYPHLYFDLICGTSTGGLIAILLAVLHLDIDTAITVYSDLGVTLFANTWRRTRFWLKDSQFNHRLMRSAISQILQQHGHGRVLMYDPTHEKGSLCFVTTAHRDRRGNIMIYRVRSYHPRGADESFPHSHEWTIMDAALATSAAPTYFKPHHIRVGLANFRFIDAGANRKNNPTDLAVAECESMGGMTDASIFISIGTGTKVHNASNANVERGTLRQTLHNMPNLSRRWTVLEGLARYATDVVEVEERMNRSARNGHFKAYHRFNPVGLGDFDLADHTAVPEMEQIVMKYFEDNREHFTEAAAIIAAWHTNGDCEPAPVVTPVASTSSPRWWLPWFR